VLDLAFFLPAVIVTGAQMVRRKAFWLTVAPAFLVFLVLTGVPILVTPVVQAVRGKAAAWGVFAPIGTLSVAIVGVLSWLLMSMRTREDGDR
jgi:uncharacterized membrane protein YhaH (DUF805 family)